jgi:hypothetical protein
MFKTILVDGDKGGVGKSLVTRALVEFYLEQPTDHRPRLVVFDADHSNPDVCGKDGLKAGDGVLSTGLIDLATEAGWIDFAGRLEKVRDLDCRVIVNMPAQIGSVFDGSVPIVAEVLREAHAVPVWVLARTQESITALEHRLRYLPAQYAAGLAVRNLFFGDSDKFVLWEDSQVRKMLLRDNGWLETELPELNDQLMVMMARRPFHEVARTGIDNKPLPLGYRLALQTWLRRAVVALSKVESVLVESTHGAVTSGTSG